MSQDSTLPPPSSSQQCLRSRALRGQSNVDRCDGGGGRHGPSGEDMSRSRPHRTPPFRPFAGGRGGRGKFQTSFPVRPPNHHHHTLRSPRGPAASAQPHRRPPSPPPPHSLGEARWEASSMTLSVPRASTHLARLRVASDPFSLRRPHSRPFPPDRSAAGMTPPPPFPAPPLPRIASRPATLLSVAHSRFMATSPSPLKVALSAATTALPALSGRLRTSFPETFCVWFEAVCGGGWGTRFGWAGGWAPEEP